MSNNLCAVADFQVQLWTMKNYHYYLKQEIYPHQAGSKRFVSMRWHPEQPMTLYVIGEGESG